MTLDRITLQAHARRLAEAFDIRWLDSELLRPEEALAIWNLRVVISRPVSDETSYAVVLHEFGHLAALNGVVVGLHRNNTIRRVQEAAAWDWAQHVALEWTPAMAQVRQLCEATYAIENDPPPAAAPADPPKPEPFGKQIDWSVKR